MNGEYKVYVHINKVNRKIYIGQTKQTLEQRSSNGRHTKIVDISGMQFKNMVGRISSILF